MSKEQYTVVPIYKREHTREYILSAKGFLPAKFELIMRAEDFMHNKRIGITFLIVKNNNDIIYRESKHSISFNVSTLEEVLEVRKKFFELFNAL